MYKRQSCETSCETSVGRDEVLGRGRTSVVTRARASGRMVAVAVKRVRVDDDAVAAQVRMEMRVLSRAMRRDRARVGGGSSSAALTATVKDGGGDARGSDSDDDARSTQSTSIVRLNGNEDKDEEGEYGDDGDDVDRYDGIVKCLGFGFHDASNVAFIRLEMMTTGSLEDVVRRGVRFESSPRAALCVVRCLANALAFLHDVARVVHRDVKPSNVLFDETGACKLCDFGLCAPADAASSPTRRLDGTVVYMSPERLASSDPRCGPESDVWGVGVTVLESVLGRPPFDIQDGGPLGLVMQIVDTVIDVDACVPGDSVDALVLRRVLTACLVKDHRRRVSVRELRDPNDERWDLSAYTRADVRAFVEAAFRVVGVQLTWRGEGVHEEGLGVVNATSPRVLVQIDPQFYRPTESAQRLVGDAGKARRLLGWEASTSVEALCAEMVESDLRLVRKGDLETRRRRA